MKFTNMLVFATLAFSAIAFAAEPDSAFQIRYASNLNVVGGDSVINLSNARTSNQGGNTGNICVNVYVFAPDEQPIACCTCPTTPNGLYSLSVINDLIFNVLTPSVPNSVVIKLNATVPPGGALTACSAALVGQTPAPGIVAWGTTVHGTPSATTGPTYQVTETAFTPYEPSNTANEVNTNAQNCQFLNFLGSGFGICKSCRLGGLGATKQ
jgi:hypothetical protein